MFQNKDFCNVIMPSEDTKFLYISQNQKSEKGTCIIYENSECLIEKIDRCKNNLENSFPTKLGEHLPSGFVMSTISSFKSIENKYDIYIMYSMR